MPIVLAGSAMIGLARSDPKVRNFTAVLTLLVLGTTHAFDAMIEHRAYMTQLAAGTVLATAFFKITTRAEDYSAQDRGLLILLGITVLIAFNLHYFSAFITGAIIASFIVSWWVLGKRTWATRLLVVAILAALPLIASYLVEQSVLKTTASAFWATTDTRTAIRHVKRLVGSAYAQPDRRGYRPLGHCRATIP
ncbi:hypothetical protein G4G27_09105 [Sphingomonas sp. So64.6b]|uniref:hypothetical protein n=1 Tax=Sphingomonas sp. So64.6b TaxID=2997354 RepID=UPI0016020B57|nr:hypothetical protein [Sphingomonas sp. So64.6b]QNA84127.1 hypothetical protein G4G27_09105 [Sphingomonas sp. So64.6b]